MPINVIVAQEADIEKCMIKLAAVVMTSLNVSLTLVALKRMVS